MAACALVPPGRPLSGLARTPGSKSITNRALLLAGLCEGASRLKGALKSDDTAHMARALRSMGVEVAEPDATRFIVVGRGRLHAPAEPLFLGNAGTAMRFLVAASALADGPVVLDGDRHMRERPIAPLLHALERLGVRAEAPTGRPPVRIVPPPRLSGGRVEVDGALSSQYVSALLMLAPCADDALEVALEAPEIGGRGYVALTLEVMERFGAQVQALSPGAWRIAPTGYRPTELEVEADASAATYAWAAGRLTGGDVGVQGRPERGGQPDAAALAWIMRFPDMPEAIDGAQMQDAVPTLAVMAAFNTRPVRFTGLANLRVKECDRLAGLARELNRLSPGLAEEGADTLLVRGRDVLQAPAAPVRLQTYGDHRMAMALSLLGLRLDGVEIDDPGCVAKTFPGYWGMLESLGVVVRRLR